MTDRRSEREPTERMLPESDSELRKALQTARQERDKARRYLDIVADLVVSLDRDGRITLINRAGCQILGYDDSELIGKHWFTTCLPTRVHRQARARFRQVIAGEKPIIANYQNHIVTRTGQERLVAWHNTLLTDGDDKIVGILSSGEDITERRRRTEEVVSAIAQGTSATVGKAFFQPLVRCLAETLGMHYAFVGEVADGNAQRVLTCAHYPNGEFLKNVEYDLADTPCANVVGKRLCCYPSGVQARFPRDRILGDIGAESYVGAPLFDSTGRALGLLVVMDQAPIANPNFAESVLQIFAARAAAELERTRAEQALRDSEERYRTLVESSPYCIHEIGLDGHLVAMNPAGLSMLGVRDEGEIVGRLLWDFVTPAHRPRVERLLNGAFAGAPADFEFNTTHDRIYQSSFVPIHDVRGAVVRVMGLTIDITEHKQAEEQARKHQTELAHVTRVSTMGEMAAGLAHELNQPLTAVVNSAQSALHRLRSHTGVRQDVLEAIELAAAQALRAAEIIRRLADFVQKHEPRRSSCNFNDAVREVVNLMAPEARDRGVRIRLELGVDLPIVLADNIQIQQVILNLVRNGIQAMSEMPAGQRVLQIQTSVVGDAVEVAVRDRGPGLTPETRERLFTPFCTTKPLGMGMGLSISRSITDAHGGRLWAENDAAGGATFHLTLPLIREQAGCENRADGARCG